MTSTAVGSPSEDENARSRQRRPGAAGLEATSVVVTYEDGTSQTLTSEEYSLQVRNVGPGWMIRARGHRGGRPHGREGRP